MSEFGEISRMNLSELKKKGQDPASDTGASDDAPEVEIIDEREHMAAPNGKHYYIDAEITPKEMRAFLFNHNYRSPLMIMATLVGIIWPVYTVLKAQGNLMMAIICMAVFVIFMPVNIWRRGGTSVTRNPLYKNTFHYMLDETGVHLELGGHAIDVEWNRVYKTMLLKSSAVLYTGKVNAYLIPIKAMGDRKDEIISFIKSHTGKNS